MAAPIMPSDTNISLRHDARMAGRVKAVVSPVVTNEIKETPCLKYRAFSAS